ncbi:MAG: class I SAM-dependent rRNA methyltransferase [Clostridiaceae bacterium]|nr:class I SAM-dependent rRNA methyltransferase [Clostridiaceae bacterium]
MKQERRFLALAVTPKGEASVRRGHPWVYAEEIVSGRDGLTNGCLADVFSVKGSYLGTGLFSEHSKIAVRLLSDNANERFEEEFFTRRVKYALDYRRAVMGGDFSCCRLIFGEADGLPGLTVDRFSDVLVAQVLSFGMEQRKDMIFRALLTQLDGIRGIYERNDVAIRTLEGLPLDKGWWNGTPRAGAPETEIVENGVRYLVDVENGQKTGFFLDQKYNRREIQRLAAGHAVLDCFTHTGSFALNAALGGAKQVTAVDISESAVALARANAERNGLSGQMDFLAADVFDLLPKLCAEHAPYDFVVLDPPAFTKSRRTVAGAERGYKEINYRAMKLLPRGGFLATCSCSHFMGSDLFERLLASAARDAGVTLKQVEARQQAPDHPILWTVPETDYLKFYIFQVV